MEIGSREWLIVGAIIFILLIVIDGWRRMRAQSNSLKIDIDDKLAELGEDNYNPELPLGSARAYVPKDTDNKVGYQSSPTNETNAQLEQDNNIVLEKASNDKAINGQGLTDQQDLNAQALANTKEAIQANIAQELNKSEHSLDSIQANDTPFDIDPLSTLGNADGIIGSKRVVQNIEQKNDDIILENSYDVEKEPQALVGKKPLVQEPPKHSEVEHSELNESVPNESTPNDSAPNDSIHKESIDAKEEASPVETKAQQPLAAIKSKFAELTIPDILKAKVEDNTVEQTKLEHEDTQSELSDTEQSIKSMSDHDDSIPSSRDFSADMFETLLEERDSHDNHNKNNSEPDELEQDDVEDTQQDNTDKEVDSEQPSFSLSDEAKQQEIAALKARLKQLSNEDDAEHSEDHFAYAKKAVDKEKESIEQVLKNASSHSGHDFTNLPTANDDEQVIKQFKDESSDINETTVVDDEVDLEDIEQELIKHPNQEELNANILKQLDALNNTDNEQTVSEQAEEIEEAEANEFELTSLQGLSANDDLDEQEVDEDVDASPVFDDSADPLMDGYDDSRSSKELVEQFNHDLAVDDQAVSNELDMPISEILKKKSQSQNQNPSTVQENNSEVVDPLLESTEPVDEIPVGIDTPINTDDKHEHELESAQPSKEPEINGEDDDHDSFDEPAIADNLGFSAFGDDPLMANFEDPYDIDEDDSEEQPDEEVAEDNREVEETQSEQALDNQADASAIDDNENELDESIDEEQISAPAKKPRKLIANVDDPEVVLIVTVVAKDTHLDGGALKQVVEACGMEFGDMDVFHRFEDDKEKNTIQFSMTNAVKPGTFDIATMEQSSTPGVSFFMSMDEPLDAKNALDCMLATAETVANHLNGSLLDDDHSVLRPQTKEHYKERIRIHEMKKLHRRS